MRRCWKLDRIDRVLYQGGVVAYPTESTYGLGCDPDNLVALDRILQIKRRPANKGMIILVSDIYQALDYLEPLTNSQLDTICQPQGRATTWLIPRKKELSNLLCGNHSRLAVRITSHPVARAICEYRDRPLVSTSCNLLGKPAAKTVTQARNQMFGKADLIVDGQCGHQAASRIIDLITGQILRA